MNAIHTEMRYFQRRLAATRAMADAAAGPCARTSHERLAELYGETLEALSVQAASVQADGPLPAFAGRSMRTLPRIRPIPPRARLTLRLAC